MIYLLKTYLITFASFLHFSLEPVSECDLEVRSLQRATARGRGDFISGV